MEKTKAIFVSEETHKKFKLKAVEAGMTFDEYLGLLMATDGDTGRKLCGHDGAACGPWCNKN